MARGMLNLILSVMIGVTVTGCGGVKSAKEVVITPKAAGSVDLKVGEVLKVILIETPTTGYVWSYKKTQNPGLITDMGHEYVTDNVDTGMVGVGGTQYYRFEAVGKGRAAITFELNRPWESEKGTPPIEKHIVNVNIS